MSTTKVFIAFGTLVVVVVTPLVLIYVLAPEWFGRYIGLAENSIVGLVGAFIVAFALDFTFRIRQERATDTVARVGMSEVSRLINGMLSLFASMIKACSDGYTPVCIQDLLGSEAAELMSRRLDLGKPSGTLPESLWNRHLSNEARTLRGNLESIQQRYQMVLSEDVVAALGTLHMNPVLSIFESVGHSERVDKLLGVQRPILNIPLESLQPHLESILSVVMTIKREATRLNSTIKPGFPASRFRDDVSPKLGSARFDGDPDPLPVNLIGRSLPS